MDDESLNDPLVASAVVDLYRRLSKKVEMGRSVQLSAADLDLLVVTGAYAKIMDAVVAEQLAISQARISERAGRSREA